MSSLAKTTLALASVSLVCLVTGCSGGATSSASGSGNGSNSNSQSTQNNNPENSAQWKNLSQQQNGYGSSSSNFNGEPLIQIDTVNKKLDLILPIPVVSGLSPIGTVSVTTAQGVTIGPALMPDGSEAWVIAIPLSLVLKGATFPSTFNALPDGQPLPFFPSEEVNGLAIALPSRPGYSINLYFGVKAVAVFVGIPKFKSPIGLGFPVVNGDNSRTVGYIALTQAVGTYPSGIYLAAQVPTDLAQLMASLLNQ